MRILSFCIVISVLLVSQSYAAGTTTIAAFGDSLFAGYGLPPEEAFPVKLEKKLTADGYSVKILAHGVSGDTTAGGLGRVDYVLGQKPDIVIVELGGNDLLRAVPAASTQSNLDSILQKFKAAGVKTILAGQVAPLNYGQKFANDYNAIFPALASKYSVPLYPSILEGILGHPALLQADGLHPTAEGVDVMVTGIAPLVEKMLTK